MAVNFTEFADRTAASVAAAEWLGDALEADLAERSRSAFVVSGGSTPAECFSYLSRRDIDWSRATVFLSDERLVPVTDPASNEAMLHRSLAVHEASSLEVVPVFIPGMDEDGMLVQFGERIEQGPSPFGVVLLGMGADGHFASLFPDFAGLPAGLDLDNQTSCMTVSTVASPHPRLSLTLAKLLDTHRLVLLAFGDDKRAVMEEAMAGRGNYPVQALFEQDQQTIDIAWAP